ncbi:hypothetical protein FHR95_002594 [Halomonas fontilapidosi]|uniref:HEPN AbiJ-N-terminal domain-containing protein n=1 Tax=Halomonas fontilapidosi TaxID=616675 RepID=A0A7W5GZY5_9GAMM|nr:hypothetical protein [Halomonas fontilapidosi]MBB3185014.1 hypothetical protein [Halomonas fontilapidosi]
MSEYFSDRERGPQPRTEETISPAVWGGVVGLINSLVSTGALGAKYPELCPDGQGPIGTDENSLQLSLLAEIPGLAWPLETTGSESDGFLVRREPYAPDTLLILDLVEFVHDRVAKPTQGTFHSFFNHHHLNFDESDGQFEFRRDINRLFARNGLSYELGEDGRVTRLAPTALRETLAVAAFRTGDATLDGMLEECRVKFINPAPTVRREAVERLWDCWERLKSLDDPQNKRKSVGTLLDQVTTESAFRQVLEDEARALTDIGNSFHIRHSEVTQSMVVAPKQVDYLFHRLFALISLLLNARGEK